MTCRWISLNDRPLRDKNEACAYADQRAAGRMDESSHESARLSPMARDDGDRGCRLFVASSHRLRRQIGFWLYLMSNVLWVIWSLHAQAYALVVLQGCLAAMNIRGERKNAT
jgi:hypothetical protein